MIVDTSALIAVLSEEPESEQCLLAMANADVLRISAVSYVEAAAVLGSRDPVLARQLDALLETAEIVLEPVTLRQAELARAAYRDFGKGGGHRARLNLGDCFPYALAIERAEPLLFKGNDFTHTGVKSALA